MRINNRIAIFSSIGLLCLLTLSVVWYVQVYHDPRSKLGGRKRSMKPLEHYDHFHKQQLWHHHPNSNPAWERFLKSLEHYAHFHKQQVTRIKSGNSTIRTLSFVCEHYGECGGMGDQVNHIQQALILAMVTDRVLILSWETSMKTFQYLLPNRVEWNLTLGRQAVRKSPGGGHAGFLRDMQSKDPEHTHIKINYQLPVPFLRDMKELLPVDKTNVFSRVSLREVLDQWKLGGETLRYLFTFSRDVFQKVEEAQKLLGIFNKPYVAAHIRTGFVGTDYEEAMSASVLKLHESKIYRSKNAWLEAINCSLRLSQANGEMPFYLATDSYAVKELAIREFGDRVKTLNITLQHAAKPIKEKSKQDKAEDKARLFADGDVGIWVDFLLLARADILVRPPTSGFSFIAGQFCPVRLEFYVPSCSKASFEAQLTYKYR